LGYPDRAAERQLLQGVDRRDLIAALDPCINPGELVELQRNAGAVHAAPAILDYIQALVEYTRNSPNFQAGLSPRAALAMLHSARAWALLEGRDKVLPEDVQAVLPGVAGHRLRAEGDNARQSAVELVAELARAVPIP
jgi:MoxR-like ATPase